MYKTFPDPDCRSEMSPRCCQMPSIVYRPTRWLEPWELAYMCFLFPALLQLQHIYEQLSKSNGSTFGMPLAFAILADINIGLRDWRRVARCF